VIKDYKPQLLLVSAGFDTLGGDPLGGMRMTPGGYGVLIGLLMAAQQPLGGHLLVLLEGGYNVCLQARAVESVLRVMAGLALPELFDEGQGQAAGIIQRVRQMHHKHWNFPAQAPL
jgi:acetoin utilization deacetylase AcuC-like enzyme